jgi:hypothetical protein
VVTSGGGQHIDDVLNGRVSLMVSRFEFAVGPVRWVRLVMETAVGQGSTEAFVKEKKQECDLDPFGGELVRVSGAIPFQQPVAFKFAQIVTELI